MNGMIVKVLETAEVFKFGKMDQDMTDFGKMAWLMVEVGWYMLMGTSMKVNGSKIKLMDMEYNKIITEAAMKANGKTTNNTVTELKSGPTAALTKESTRKA